ncbi:MAG: hypothetical protein HQL32_16650 [Planctomycetes bacterium]|nr:hypothetical protein [Planctomycetota bacterium]
MIRIAFESSQILALAIFLNFALNKSFAEESKHLFILSGQSNMAGLDIETSFVPGIESHFGAEKAIALITTHSTK